MAKEDLEKLNRYLKSANDYLETSGTLWRFCCKCTEEIRELLIQFHDEYFIYSFGENDEIKFPASEMIELIENLKYAVEYADNYFKGFNNKKDKKR